MNMSPYSLIENTNLPRIFRIFRGLGLRHLIITDEQNRVIYFIYLVSFWFLIFYILKKVVGITTRIDIAKYKGHVGLTHASIKELTILQ
jgi:chloride channel 7